MPRTRSDLAKQMGLGQGGRKPDPGSGTRQEIADNAR